MRRCPRVALLAAAFLLCPGAAQAADTDRLLAPPGACGAQDDRSATPREQRRAMRCMINHARTAAGLAPLRTRATGLGRAADLKAADILQCGEFSHTACGRGFIDRMKEVGYATGCYSAGENIAWGTGRLGTVRAIMQAWLSSEGHRATLLDPRFRDHGVGMRSGALAGEPGAVVWVHQLGRRC